MGASVYHVVSQFDLQTITDHACRYYRIPVVPVTVYDNPDDRSLGEFARYEVDGEMKSPRIHLNRGFHGANVSTLLHELAHYVTGQLYVDYASHGPQFVAIYMHLLDKYRIMPSCAFRALAKKCKVQIAGKFKP